MRFRLFAGVMTALAAAVTVFGQHHEHGGGAVKAAPLTPGFGPVHHAIQTTSEEAQKYFDQGLNLMYGFNHDEAVRSFRRAAELDSKAIMPLWGMAFALGPNINLDREPGREQGAREAVAKAMKLMPQAAPQERAYVEAIAKRYSEDPKADAKKLAYEFAMAMGGVMRAYPDDLDAATIYAESLMDLTPWKLWTKDGKPGQYTEEIVQVLESVLRRDPSHIGANHYYIHAVEASKTPERALASADRLGMLAPAAGHLVHMPGHIYMQLGELNRTVETNTAAMKADESYIQATGVQGIYPLMYYTHNVHFVAVARAGQGNYKEAIAHGKKMHEIVKPALKEMPMLEMFAVVPMFIEVQFGRWDEVLAWPQAEPQSALYPVRLYGRALAFAAKGEVAKADREVAALKEAVAKVPADAPFGAANQMKPVLDVAVAVAEARIAWARGDREGAVAKWGAAVAAADLLNYDEPSAWYYQVRQSLGGALLLTEKNAEAETVFREALVKNPRDGRLLFGLWKSLEAQKKPGAPVIRAQFEEAWKSADVRLKVEDL